MLEWVQSKFQHVGEKLTYILEIDYTMCSKVLDLTHCNSGGIILDLYMTLILVAQLFL